MNVIFTAIFILSAIILCFTAPAEFLPALLGGGQRAITTAVTLFCVYAVWMGLSAVAEDCRLTQKGAKLLAPLCGKLFKTKDQTVIKDISMNLSCNLLGIGGAATPYGVKAVEGLEKEDNRYAQNLLFIINATSIQLIPATVIALRASAGSLSAADITLPSLLATAVSTFVGAGLYILIESVKGRTSATVNRRTKGARGKSR